MELLHYTYLPKEQSIAYQKVARPLGYSGHKIHMHDHHELVLVTTKAHCRLVNNGNSVQLDAPCLIINRSGSFHEVVEVRQGDYESQVVYFHPQAFVGVPEQLLFEKKLFGADLTAIALTQSQLEQLLPLFTMLGSRSYAQQLPLLLTVFAAVSQILNEGAAAVRREAADNYIFDVIELLQTQQESCTLSELSHRFHICPTKLKTDFKRITGMPVMTYKNLIRLEKAKLLLATTHMEQTQIAYTCGFADESYFIRAFKKQYGITPAVYRRSK